MMLPTENIKKIIIFRALQLGDMLCVIPAIRALKQAYPQAKITLTGLPWAKSLVSRFPHYFDSFIHFPGYPGLPEQEVDPLAFTAFLTEVQKQQFDLALQMQGNGSIVNPMVELFNASFTAGFCKKDDYALDNGLFLQYPNHGSEIKRHLLLMEHLGISPQGTALEFPLTREDEEDLMAVGLPLLKSQRYICIHPGSRGAWRQWPTAHFASLADYCIKRGFQVVLTGTKDELGIVDEVSRKMKLDPVIAAGKTNLGAMGVLIKNSFMLISNCTGVSHMAAAFKTPSIVISMDGEPDRWAPLNRELHFVIDWTVNPDFLLVQQHLKSVLETPAKVLS